MHSSKAPMSINHCHKCLEGQYLSNERKCIDSQEELIGKSKLNIIYIYMYIYIKLYYMI